MENAAESKFDVGSWSNVELLKLFHSPTTDTELDERSKGLIAKALTSGKRDLAEFLQRAAEKLRLSTRAIMSNPDYREQSNPITMQVAKHEDVPSDKEMTQVTGTSRKNNKEVLDKTTGVPRVTQVSRNLGQQTVYDSAFQQGNVNPLLIQRYQRVICLNSAFRSNLYPYSAGNVSGPASSTNYHATLNEPLRNTTSLKLQSVSIPRVWDNISCAMGNAVIGLRCNDTKDICWYSAPDGYYELTTLTNMKLTKIEPSTTCSSFPDSLSVSLGSSIAVLETPVFISVSSDGITSSESDSSNINRIVKLTATNGALDFDIVMYADNMPTCGPNTQTCYNSTTVNRNLATTLGFAPIKPSDISDHNNHKLIIAGSLKTSAVRPPDLIGIKYFMIVLDDYNSNRINNSVVGIAEPANRIAPPPSVFRSKVGKECVYTYSQPRTKTQNQLYSDNEKLISQKALDNGSQAPSVGNVLSLCPVSNGEYGTRLTLTGTAVNSVERIYFGPVSLEKVKVRLLDDVGRVVDLKGHDWSISLVAEQLYQY
tara:strand:- start:19211 stop:20827 length:1617 start_codon:yes stop_codon:yes gene_type:complete